MTQKAKAARWSREEFESTITSYLESLEIPYRNLSLYTLAFVHRSAVNEHPDWFPEHNERLEFLGDAVLELIITEALFLGYPERPEWQLTDIRSALVRGAHLGPIAQSLDMSEHLQMSRGEIIGGGKNNLVILADTFEAFLWAIYLDTGYESARTFVITHVYPTVENVIENKLHIDPKSHLQEITQRIFSETPRYDLLSEAGLDHDKTYTIGVHVRDSLIGIGTGASKKKAQQSAAQAALERKREWTGKKKRA